MTKRELEKRIEELERQLAHEADSLTRLYTRVEMLERKLGSWPRGWVGTVPLGNTTGPYNEWRAVF